MSHRVLVCGSRKGFHGASLVRLLDGLLPRPTVVIHGGAPGVDSQAGAWARMRGVEVEEYPADWRNGGPMAGPIRNARMLRDGRPDLVLAFPGGSGTHNMTMQAKRAGVPVVEVMR